MEENKTAYLTIFKRKYLINRDFQLRFILYSMAVAFTIILAIFFTSSYFFDDFMERGKAYGLAEGHVYYTFLEQQRHYMNQLLITLSAFYFVGLSIFGLALSHRIAGPLHRLNRHMWAVAKGEVSRPVSFRKMDYFKELAEAYNAQYEYLKAQSKEEKNHLAKDA